MESAFTHRSYGYLQFSIKGEDLMTYTNVEVPAQGEKITIEAGKLHVPDNPIIPFVEGDGTGRDIWRASKRVLDAAVEKSYQGRRVIRFPWQMSAAIRLLGSLPAPLYDRIARRMMPKGKGR